MLEPVEGFLVDAGGSNGTRLPFQARRPKGFAPSTLTTRPGEHMLSLLAERDGYGSDVETA